MLYPRPTPLNRRPTVPNLPNPHRGHPPAQRVRSPAKSRPLGSISLLLRIDVRLALSGAEFTKANKY
jgi:hypothetical protein